MGSLLVRGARSIDGTGARAVDEAILLTENGRITGIGQDAPADVTIDAAGLTLIPGLIDCHVHLVFDGRNPDFAADAAALTEDTARARAATSIKRALDAGITTVRDLGGVFGAPLGVARAQARGELDGARVITASQVLTAPGGHAHFIGLEIGSVEEMTKAVRALHDDGATAIKIIATGGVLTPGIGAQQSAFPPEQLEACVNEAHARGLRVAAHAIGAEGIEAAVAAGVDSIEHGCFLSDAGIAAMVANPTWLVPTLSAPERISNGGPGVPDYARAKSEEVQTHHRDSFARAHAAGVRIATGTDAGTPYNFHGMLRHELGLMHGSGMPLDRILQAATREAATLLGLGDVGTLELGKIADVVLLDGDPLSDITAYERVIVVVQGGRIVVDNR